MSEFVAVAFCVLGGSFFVLLILAVLKSRRTEPSEFCRRVMAAREELSSGDALQRTIDPESFFLCPVTCGTIPVKNGQWVYFYSPSKHLKILLSPSGIKLFNVGDKNIRLNIQPILKEYIVQKCLIERGDGPEWISVCDLDNLLGELGIFSKPAEQLERALA